MLFTRANLDSWLFDKNGAAQGYTALTKKILQYGGGEIAVTDPYQWLFRKPPTVRNFDECRDLMVDNQAFEEYIIAQNSDNKFGESAEDDWENFDSKDTWDFMRSAEVTYDCAGFCYVPMFYLTRDISEGQPTQECLKPIFNAAYADSQYIFMISGTFLALIGCC